MADLAKPRIRETGLSLFILLVTAKAVYSLWRIITTSAPDFAYYYQAAQNAVHWVDEPMHLLPPVSLLLYAPLQILPYDVAQGGWVLISFFCLIAVVSVVSRSVGIKNARTIACITAFSYLSFPTQFTLGMGQVNLIALALVVAAVFIENRRRSVWAGCIMAIAWLFKPELILLLPVFWIRGRWLMLGAIACTLGVAVILSIGLWGIGPYVVYGQRMAPLSQGLTDAGIYYNQSITGLLIRAGVTSTWLRIAVSATLWLATCYVLWKKPKPFVESVWWYMPTLLLIEPIAWQHHFVFLIPMFIMLWAHQTSGATKRLVVLSYLLISWNFALSQFLDTMPLGWLVASHGAIGALILWGMTL